MARKTNITDEKMDLSLISSYQSSDSRFLIQCDDGYDADVEDNIIYEIFGRNFLAHIDEIGLCQVEENTDIHGVEAETITKTNIKKVTFALDQNVIIEYDPLKEEGQDDLPLISTDTITKTNYKKVTFALDQNIIIEYDQVRDEEDAALTVFSEDTITKTTIKKVTFALDQNIVTEYYQVRDEDDDDITIFSEDTITKTNYKKVTFALDQNVIIEYDQLNEDEKNLNKNNENPTCLPEKAEVTVVDYEKDEVMVKEKKINKIEPENHVTLNVNLENNDEVKIYKRDCLFERDFNFQSLKCLYILGIENVSRVSSADTIGIRTFPFATLLGIWERK